MAPPSTVMAPPTSTIVGPRVDEAGELTLSLVARGAHYGVWFFGCGHGQRFGVGPSQTLFGDEEARALDELRRSLVAVGVEDSPLLPNGLQRREGHPLGVTISLYHHSSRPSSVGHDHDRGREEVDHVRDVLGHGQQAGVGRQVHPTVVIDVVRVGTHDPTHDLAEGKQSKAVGEVDHHPETRDVDTFGHHVDRHDPRVVRVAEKPDGVGGVGIVLVPQSRTSNDRPEPEDMLVHMVGDLSGVVAVDAHDEAGCIVIALSAQPHDVAVGVDEHLLGDRSLADPLEG